MSVTPVPPDWLWWIWNGDWHVTVSDHVAETAMEKGLTVMRYAPVVSRPDELERLRAENKRLTAEVERLKQRTIDGADAIFGLIAVVEEWLKRSDITARALWNIQNSTRWKNARRHFESVAKEGP